MQDAAKQQAIAHESCTQIMHFAASYRGEGQIFDAPVNVTELSAQASAYLQHFSAGWVGYMQHLSSQSGKPGRSDHATTLVAAMLRYVEDEAPLGDDDAKRLWPLARWMEDGLLSLQPSFDSLVNPAGAV
jgi:hypothetical protein